MDKKLILLTNDDGILAPGLTAMHHALARLGEVYVVAPATEQSGVSQSVTFRTPLVIKDVLLQGERWGWAVEGSPADCVKVGVCVLCPRKPDVVVSGINWGQNAGINILYSGTVGAAMDGAIVGIPSFALSIQDAAVPPFERAAAAAADIIEQILQKIEERPEAELDYCGNLVPDLYNINFSAGSLESDSPEIVVTPMDTTPYANALEERIDTFHRKYYWLTPNPRSRIPERTTDMNELKRGKIIVTPLLLDRTNHALCKTMQDWDLSTTVDVSASDATSTYVQIKTARGEIGR
ncbi:MAG: 5'/3'-nucleotidase SurE [Planctomycetia bacterium]|nr:5'/3'-nucleotidase SurE [Planctomycetia bacterium]